jgi:hypothetical protein
MAQRVSQLTKREERQTIMDLIRYSGEAIPFGNFVCMDPLLIWSSHLLVHKLSGRVPAHNSGQPGKGYSKKSQVVFDMGSFLNKNRLGRNDMEMQLWWGYGFSIASFRKERKNLFSGKGELHRCCESVFHKG